MDKLVSGPEGRALKRFLRVIVAAGAVGAVGAAVQAAQTGGIASINWNTCLGAAAVAALVALDKYLRDPGPDKPPAP